MLRLRLPFALCVLALGALAVGCEDRTRTKRIIEPFTVVPGTPSVETGTPQVIVDPTRATDHFAVNVPRQCDFFQQLSVRKVDILWVVDSSGSMAPKQTKLALATNSFIQQLKNANPPIDFHIAVVSTDTDDSLVRGELRPWTLAGFTANFIACSPQTTGGVRCNTDGADPTGGVVAAFGQMAKVGINGSAQERGLYAAYLALTNPVNISGATEKFIRADAALYVVMVSDEDDSSCSPLTRQPVCTADPGCRCASNQVLSTAGNYGSTDWFTHFFETYKGFNNQDLVAVAAIVAREDGSDGGSGVPSQFGDPSPHVGCCRLLDGGAGCPTSGSNDGGLEVAYFGDRYIKVANDTGGVAVDICDNDYGSALAALGYAASGLRKEFRLTRGPVLDLMGTTAAGITMYEAAPNAANCTVDGNCPAGAPHCRAGKCARQVSVSISAAPNAAQYVKCDGLAPRNIIRFDGTAVPDSLSTLEVCYDVQPNFTSSCP